MSIRDELIVKQQEQTQSLIDRVAELDTQLKEVSKALNEMTGDWLAKGRRISELEKERDELKYTNSRLRKYLDQYDKDYAKRNNIG